MNELVKFCYNYWGYSILADIRKTAIKVNDRLKNLIINEDDDDIATDIADEVKVNLMSGSPSKRGGREDKRKLETTPTLPQASDMAEGKEKPGTTS